MKKFLAAAVSIMVFAMFAGSAQATPLVLRFAGQSAPDQAPTITMKKIAKEVEQNTNGRIKIKIYPASQLGDYTLVYEELTRGTIDMAMISQPSQFDPRMGLLYINYFVKGYDDLKKVFAPNAWLFKKMEKLNGDLGVQLLGFYIEGMIGIGSTKPVKEPLNPKVEKGILLRVSSINSVVQGAQAMGYRTVTIPYADVYQALQTGVCDGVDGFPVPAAYAILGDAIKYWYNINFSPECLSIMMSKNTMGKINKADQKVIRDICMKYTKLSLSGAEAEDEKYLKLMEKKGIKVYRYTPKQVLPLAKACYNSWDKLSAEMTPQLIKEFKKEMAPK